MSWVKYVLVSGAVISLIYGVYYSQTYIKNRVIPPVSVTQEPFLHTEDGVPMTEFHPGQALEIRTFTTRVVPCTVTISYTILQSDKIEGVIHRVFWHSFRTTPSFTGVGAFVTDERRRIPEWIPPGEYFFNRYAAYDCDGVKVEQKNSLPLTLILPAMHDGGTD